MLARTRVALIVCAALAGTGPAALAQPTMPNEFETPGVALGPLFSYFGGVNGFGVEPSATTIHSGNSLRVWANFQQDVFSISGFAVGTLGISPPRLAVPAGADTFSVTIDAPQTTGTLAVIITVREDDNGDGAIDVNGDDDGWEAGPFFLTAGRQVINVPSASFELANPGSGNGVRNFTTTQRMGYFLTFETRNAWPGGRVVTPVSLHVDHLGFYVGAQSLPPGGCAPDFDGDGALNVSDIFAFLSAWFAGSMTADFDASGAVAVPDIFAFLSAWFTGC